MRADAPGRAPWLITNIDASPAPAALPGRAAGAARAPPAAADRQPRQRRAAGQYIRFGLRWPRVEPSLRALLTAVPDRDLQVAPTTSAPNVTSMVALVRYG